MTKWPTAKKRHSDSAHRLLFPLHAKLENLRAANRDAAFGEARMETGYLLGRNPGTWLVPDVSVTWAGQPGEDYFEGAPMIAFEIISESNYPAYVARKRKKYLSCGAAEVWVFYPKTRHALVYTTSAERREETAFHTDLLPGIEIPFADFL